MLSDDIIALIVRLFMAIFEQHPEQVSRVLDTLPGAEATREALRKRGIDVP